MAIPLKDCKQCSHYRGGFCYGFGTAKRVFSTAEAILCGTYTPLGQVQIGPIHTLSGQLVALQIPESIITTLKIADAAVTLAKLSTSSVNDSKVAPAAGIVESKLSLAFGTSALNTDIQTREQSANKDQSNGYLGLDAGAKVPLSKLNPLTNSEIAVAAEIVESKLSLIYGTQALHNDIQTRALQATYAAHNHSPSDPTQVDHANLINVLTNQHHVKTTSISDLTDHNKANHDSLGLSHDSLADVSESDHHVKYTDANAKAACVSDTAYSSSWNAVTNVAPSKNAVYDKINTHENDDKLHQVVPCHVWLRNGAVMNSCGATAVVQLPASDGDATVQYSFQRPSTWTSIDLIIYFFIPSANYSFLLSVSDISSGEIESRDIKNNEANTFSDVGTTLALATKSIALTSLSGKIIGVRIGSNSAGNPVVYIVGVVLQKT